MKQAIKKIATAGRKLVADVKSRKATKKWLLDLAKQQRLTPHGTRNLLRKYKNGRVLVGPERQKLDLLRYEASHRGPSSVLKKREARNKRS